MAENFRWLIGNDAVQIVLQDLFYFGGMIRCMNTDIDHRLKGKQSRHTITDQRTKSIGCQARCAQAAPNDEENQPNNKGGAYKSKFLRES